MKSPLKNVYTWHCDAREVGAVMLGPVGASGGLEVGNAFSGSCVEKRQLQGERHSLEAPTRSTF